jgi:hypothetical protein
MTAGLKNRLVLFFIGLTIFAFTLWIISLVQARDRLSLGMSELGLFSILPLSFFAAFSLLLLTFFFTVHYESKYRSFLLIIQTILLFLFLNLSPTLIENTARFTAAYVNFRATDYISQTGYIASSATWILNWPGFSVFVSNLIQVTTLNSQLVLMIYPTFFNIALLLCLFLFFRLVLDNSEQIWIATWFVFLGNWIGQDYLSMQSLAFLMIIFILYLIFKNLNSKIRSRKWLVLLLIFFAFIISSHLLSSMIFASVLFVFFIGKRLRRFNLFAIAIILIVAWSIFCADAYLTNNLLYNLGQALNFASIFQRNLQTRIISGSELHTLVTQIRVIYTIILVCFGALGITTVLWHRRIQETDKRVLLLALSFGLLIFSFAYGGELFMRLYMFSLIPLAYFATKYFFKHKRIFVVAILFFILVTPTLVIISRYGNESIDYVPISELTGVQFIYSHVTSGSIIGSTNGADFRDLTYRQGYTLKSLYYEIFERNESNSLWVFDHSPTKESRLLCLSYESKQFFTTYAGHIDFLEELKNNATKSVIYNLVYSNPSFEVYSKQP